MAFIKKYIVFMLSPILRIFSLIKLIGNAASILKDLMIFTSQFVKTNKQNFKLNLILRAAFHKKASLSILDGISAMFFLSFIIELFFDLPLFVYWNTAITGLALLMASIAKKIDDRRIAATRAAETHATTAIEKPTGKI